MTPKQAQQIAHKVATYHYNAIKKHYAENIAIEIACAAYCEMFDSIQVSSYSNSTWRVVSLIDKLMQKYS